MAKLLSFLRPGYIIKKHMNAYIHKESGFQKVSGDTGNYQMRLDP